MESIIENTNHGFVLFGLGGDQLYRDRSITVYPLHLINDLFEQVCINKDIIKINPEAEASGVIGSIEEDATSSMLSDLVFTPFDIPNDRQLRGKLILDCIKRIELDSIKDLKRLINLRLSKDAELTDKDEKELLNELKDLIDREKQLQ